MSGHFIEFYSCGHVADQCRCAAKDKTVRHRTEPCPKCIDTHDWRCGCGHWNGPNLYKCAQCYRRPGARA